MQHLELLLFKATERMKTIQNTSIIETCKISNIDIDKWEWPQGVGLYGMMRRYRNTEDSRVLDWINTWIETNLQRGLPERNVNTTAPMLTVAQVGKLTKNEKYLNLSRDWAEWIMHKLPRTKYGGFQHVTSDVTNNEQLWDDTLFMTVLFLAQMGVIDGRRDYIDECEFQFLLHARYLTDPKTGLWYHGWTFNEEHNFANALWGRGNCWITIFIPDFLEMTGLNCGSRKFMTSVLQNQAEALLKFQDENGMWHTLISDETSYCETSATAGFAYGLLKGVRLGLLDKSYKEAALKAARAVMDNILPDGTVQGVSSGTAMGQNLQFYRDIPQYPMAYGQALTMLMLEELLENF